MERLGGEECFNGEGTYSSLGMMGRNRKRNVCKVIRYKVNCGFWNGEGLE